MNRKQLMFNDEDRDRLLLTKHLSIQQSDVWKIAIVDDDLIVHETTKLALDGFTFDEKPLNILSAYSGQEAKELIANNPDIALVLLDLVMETKEAGLDVVKYIRENLKNQFVRIILRTGQPAEAPEVSIILNYDINDYKTKLELTAPKLITTIVLGLRSYQELQRFKKKSNYEKISSVLVVDDNPYDLQVVRDILPKNKYKIRASLSGKLAICSAKSTPPDLILLDVKLPDIDGFEVCKILKLDPKTQTVPIIFVSASHQTAEKVKAFEVGGIDYVTKPFNPEEIIARIDTHLANQRLRQQWEEQNQLLQKEINIRQSAEENLRKYERIFSMTGDGICLLDRNYTYQLSNPAYLTLIEKTVDEVIGHTVKEVLGVEIFENLLKPRLDKCLQGEEVHDELWVNFPRSGRKYIGLTYTPYFDTKNSVSGIIVSVRDLSAIKQTEEALRESQERFETFMKHTPFAAWIADLQGNMVYANEGYLRSLKLPVEEVVGKNFFELFPAEVAHQYLQNNQNVWQTGQVLETVEFAMRKDGSPGNFLVYKFPISDRFQEYLIAGVAIDITERQRIEASLRQSESILRSFFNSGSMMMGIVELYDDDILHISDNIATAQFFGTTTEEMENRFASDMGIESSLLAFWISYYREAERRQAPVKFEYYHQTSQGEKWLSATVCPIEISPNGRPRFSYIVEDATNRKQAELALQERETMLRSIGDNLPNGMIYQLVAEADGTYHFSYISAGVKRFVEAGPEAVIRDASLLHQQIVEEDRLRNQELTEESRRNLSIYQIQMRQRTYQGEIRWSDLRSAPRRTPDGRTIWDGIEIDITDIKNTEEALRKSQQELAEAQKIAHLGSWYFDLITQEIFWSEESFRIHGLDPTESPLTYQQLLAIIHPEDLEKFQQNVQTAIAEGKSYEHEIRIYKPDGSMRYTWGKGQAVCDRTGRVIKLVGTVQDITDRKIADLELRESEEKFRQLAENIREVFFILSETGQILYISPAYEQVWGRSCESLYQNPRDWLESVHPEERPEIAIALTRQISETTDFDRTYRIVRLDGEIRWIRARSLPVPHQQSYRFVGIAEDITQQVLVEEQLRQAKELADAANRAKSEFLANMSHEIRTPMNAILGFCDLLQGMVNETQQNSFLNAIATSGKTLLALINDILDLSKIEAGKLTLQFEPVNLRALIKEIHQIFSLKAREKNIQFLTEIADTVPTGILIDEVRLRQILFNVVGNALKFTERGYVKISAIDHLSSITIIVEDTGIGIALEQQERIFDAFVQSEGQSTRKYGGTGLGLAITKRLTEMLGGKIQLHSELGKGSTFTFIFPNVEVADIPLEPICENYLDNDLNQFQTTTILIVDDVRSNLDLMKGYFAESQHKLLFAQNGQEAIAQTEKHHPDLILMDLWMPILNGLAAAEYLRKQPETQNTPIVFITASSRPQDEVLLKNLATGFLRKPVSRSELVLELKKILPVKENYSSTNDEPLAAANTNNWICDARILARLPELRDKLREEQEYSWEQLRQTMKRRDVQAFAQRLREWAVEYQYQPLLNYAQTLEAQLVAFDWESLPKTIEEYPQVWQSLL